MTIIHAKQVDGQAVLPLEDFQRLLTLACKSEPVDVQTPGGELFAPTMMRLAESGGAFDFWKEPGEDVYSAGDGEPI